MDARTFGRKLVVRFPRLSDRDRRVLDGVIKPARRQQLEGDEWNTVSYRELFHLTAMSDPSHPSVRAARSHFWKTFDPGSPSRFARVVLGSEPDGSAVKSDLETRYLISQGDFKSENAQVTTRDTEKIRGWMADDNVITIGGPKVNHASDMAFEQFARLGGPIVKFYWPGLTWTSAVAAPAEGAERVVEIAGQRFEESTEGRRHLGVLGWCLSPSSDRPVCTVVISGASHQATIDMLHELSNPMFYRLFDDGWAEKPATPIAMLYDSASVRKWRVFGAEKIKRGPGRPRKTPTIVTPRTDG